MGKVKNEYILYGLKGHKEIIEEVIQDLQASECHYDIKLILTEALVNAYEHGNNGDGGKPVYLRYEYENGCAHFEIEDCGNPAKQVKIPECADETGLLECRGRGLFLIRCFADKVEYVGQILVIEKTIKSVKKYI